MNRHEAETGRISEHKRRLEASDETFEREQHQDHAAHERRRLPRCARECTHAGDPEARENEEHQRRMSDHPRAGHIVAGDSAPVLGDDVEPTIADAVLLVQLAARVLAPAMHASRSPTEGKSVAGAG
jgi:hypothetical protein